MPFREKVLPMNVSLAIPSLTPPPSPYINVLCGQQSSLLVPSLSATYRM